MTVFCLVLVCVWERSNDVKQFFNSFLTPPPFCQPVLTSATPSADVNYTATTAPLVSKYMYRTTKILILMVLA